MSYYYQPGGTLSKESPTYVTRQADHEFYEGLAKGEFCYVLNARQMGKSSLQVRTQERLEAAGVACGMIDISKFGSTCTTEQFYAGVIFSLAKKFHLQNFDIEAWWDTYKTLSPVHHFDRFLEEVLLVQVTQPIVIFIDESDALRRFSEDFFVVVRSCYNVRSQNPAYKRLTFGILGVASPTDLIADDKITPFNIGRAIDLTGFQLSETEPLEKGLTQAARPKEVLAEVLKWTGGQPFLTQRLCAMISRTAIPAGEEASWVEQLVKKQVIGNWLENDEQAHLQTIRDRLLYSGGTHTGRLLGLYQQVLAAGEAGIVARENNPDELRLRLTGLVVKRQGRLQVYNPIYAAVFNADWIRSALDNLRPYADGLRSWEANQKNASWLLRGQALTAALTWAQNKSLAEVDHEFLTASRLAEAKVGAQRQFQRFLLVALVLALGLVGVAGWQWWKAEKQAEMAQLRYDGILYERQAKQEVERRSQEAQVSSYYQQALVSYQKALDISQTLKDDKAQAINLSDIGMMYLSLNEPARALVHFEAALKIHQQFGDREREKFENGNLVVAHGKLGHVEKATELYQQATGVTGTGKIVGYVENFNCSIDAFELSRGTEQLPLSSLTLLHNGDQLKVTKEKCEIRVSLGEKRVLVNIASSPYVVSEKPSSLTPLTYWFMNWFKDLSETQQVYRVQTR